MSILSPFSRLAAAVMFSKSWVIHRTKSSQPSDSSYCDWLIVNIALRYTDITNIVVRLSSSDASKRNAILVNAHTDSTLPSPGAADDLAGKLFHFNMLTGLISIPFLGVAVMLEILRVMGMRNRSLENSVVLLFNGGEESLQDASHLFSTQFDSTIVKSLKSVVSSFPITFYE
jgi:hypothetical protein